MTATSFFVLASGFGVASCGSDVVRSLDIARYFSPLVMRSCPIGHASKCGFLIVDYVRVRMFAIAVKIIGVTNFNFCTPVVDVERTDGRCNNLFSYHDLI